MIRVIPIVIILLLNIQMLAYSAQASPMDDIKGPVEKGVALLKDPETREFPSVQTQYRTGSIETPPRSRTSPKGPLENPPADRPWIHTDAPQGQPLR